jgi:hypothetical protein
MLGLYCTVLKSHSPLARQNVKEEAGEGVPALTIYSYGRHFGAPRTLKSTLGHLFNSDCARLLAASSPTFHTILGLID